MGILIVDDSVLIRQQLSDLLEARGYEYVEAKGSVREAYAYLLDKVTERGCDSIELVLMDIEMPEMDGIKGAKLLKAHKAMRDIPVVMVTTKRGSDALRKAFAAGAVDFINKPVNEVELLARVDSVLRLKREMDLRQARERELSEANLLLKEANERLEKLSRMDGLTGAPNRRYFNDNFHKEWLRCARDKKHLSIIMIDIDFFKKYNDAYGHLQGDECLKQVAGAISSAVRRPGDLFARYGGEEFVVMLPDTNVAGAKEVSEIIRKKLDDLKIEHEDSDVADVVTLSQGLASLIPKFGQQPETLVTMADQALYDAKEQGRNRTIVYENNGPPAAAQ